MFVLREGTKPEKVAGAGGGEERRKATGGRILGGGAEGKGADAAK